MTREAVNNFLSAFVIDETAQELLNSGLPHSALNIIYTTYGDQLSDLDPRDQKAILTAAESAKNIQDLAKALNHYLNRRYDLRKS